MFRQTRPAIGFIGFTSMAAAQQAQQYTVTITNLTPGQTFTGQFVATHG